MRLKRWFNSLQVRILLSGLLMILIIMPSVALILNNAFSAQLQTSINKELVAHSYAVMAVSNVEVDTLLMPDYLLENQFNVSETGLYAMINQVQPTNNVSTTLWRSQSMLGMAAELHLPAPELGRSAYSEILINDAPHWLYSFTASYNVAQTSFEFTVHIIKDQHEFNQSVKDFRTTLWFWVILLTTGLVVLQFIWLRVTLKPLSTLRSELESVEQGKSKQLRCNYPLELERVATQLNLLLSTEDKQRKRYRNALSDLAHSLKTPLAVIKTQVDLTSSSQQQLSLINQTIERQLKRAQSGGQSAWHLGVTIAPLAQKLINSLSKIYHDKRLTIAVDIDDNAEFKGEEADFLEMLGNLLDNACKAANTQVKLSVSCDNSGLCISVSDDGQGISDDIKQDIIKRGTRADTYQQGHGIGLAIVRDLVTSYQGQLTISQSGSLGGAKFIIHLKQ